MSTFILRRLLQAVPTLLGITLISFALMRLAPGDPVLLLTFQPKMTPEAREQLRHQLCLDRSLPEQYLVWLFGDWTGECHTRGLVRGDLGTSLSDKRPVLDMIVERIPATLELTTTALVVGLVIGTGVGVYSAVKQRSLFDNASRFLAVMGNAIPAFWLGLVLILIFSVKLGWLPVGGRYTLNIPGGPNLADHLKHLVMPAFVLATGWVAVLSRFMRTETLEVIRQDYVRAALARGVHRGRVYFWHVARNALIPLVTLLGPAIAGLLAGAVVTERIFSWPGMGRLMIDAVFQRDYPLLMADVILGACLVVLGNLLSDVLYVMADPRIRLS